MKRSTIFMSIAFLLATGMAMISRAHPNFAEAWKNPGCSIEIRPPFCNTTGIYTCTVLGVIYYRDFSCLVELKKNTP